MKEERGSAKLIRERMGGSGEIREADIARIIDLVDLEDIVLERWWWKGQPAIDFIAGTFQVPRKQAGSIIDRLLDTELQLELKAFPVGIPDPEKLIISFRSGME